MITGKLDYLPIQFVNALDHLLERNPRLQLIEDKGQLKFLMDGHEVPVNTLYYWYRESLATHRQFSPDVLDSRMQAG